MCDVKFPYETTALHFGLFEEGAALDTTNESRLLGCVLFKVNDTNPSTGRLFQMAVAPDQQGKGLGRVLVSALEDHLRSGGSVKEITLHAREVAVGFYLKLGYSIFGEEFEEVGVKHRHMRKDI